MVDITILNGGYKPTFKSLRGGGHGSWGRAIKYIMILKPNGWLVHFTTDSKQ